MDSEQLKPHLSIQSTERKGFFFFFSKSKVRSCFALTLTFDKPDIPLHNEQQSNGSGTTDGSSLLTLDTYSQGLFSLVPTGLRSARLGLCGFLLVNGTVRYHFSACSAGVPKGWAGTKPGL